MISRFIPASWSAALIQEGWKRRALPIVAAIAGFLALVLLILLSVATSNTAFFDNNFIWLYAANVVVGLCLLTIILVLGAVITVRWKQKRFGTRLIAKLAMIFALVGVVPGIILYGVSWQFVSRSIETWFDEQVQTALDAGLELGKRTVDNFIANSTEKTLEITQLIAQTQSDSQVLLIERLREQTNANYLGILAQDGSVIFEALRDQHPKWLQRKSGGLTHITTWIKQADTKKIVTLFDGLDNTNTHRAIAKVVTLSRIPETGFHLNTHPRYILLERELPSDLAERALTVQVAYTEYQQRALARDGLRQTYIGTLTLALILVILGAVFLAALLGHQLAKPLLILARGMHQVASGDLSIKPVLTTRDELSGLTRDFAAMTEQLEQARSQADRSMNMLASSRTRLQTILDSLSAGVIVFDADQRIDTVNPSATHILHLPLSNYRGSLLQSVPELVGFSQRIWERFDLHASRPEAGENNHWQDTFELDLPHAKTQLVLLIRGALLPNNAHLMVFDDITEITSAQRSAAWTEVARRVAHEIKNPLTPIQLSAQRLQHKLQPKLDAPDQALLHRSVTTIVEQVQSMIKLVNEFRNYARMPAAQLTTLDLNSLILDVMALYAQAIEQRRITLQCDSHLPPIQGDAAQLRQVIHNLVQNGLDATEDITDGCVEVITQWVKNEQGQARAVRLFIRDNGPGFSPDIIQRAYEPYVTTKAKGTGLGLAVVRKIAEEHHARIRIGNRQDVHEPQTHFDANKSLANPSTGAEVSLSFPLITEA